MKKRVPTSTEYGDPIEPDITWERIDKVAARVLLKCIRVIVTKDAEQGKVIDLDSEREKRKN